MQRWQILDSDVTPDGRELVLSRRGDMYLIQVDAEELMSSRAHGSEDALARLALEALGGRPGPRVLVGGLGMGFTLRALLDALTERAGSQRGQKGHKTPAPSVIVAEVFPIIVEWNRTHLGHLAGHPLDDRRVRVQVGDVADRLRADDPYDVILLDVDNGPDAFTLDRNRFLYTAAGLERIAGALTPGGVLAVWSADDDPRYVDQLHRAGFTAKTHRVHARAVGKGGRHAIFVARKSRKG
jgi:spermidine synthase